MRLQAVVDQVLHVRRNHVGIAPAAGHRHGRVDVELLIELVEGGIDGDREVVDHGVRTTHPGTKAQGAVHDGLMRSVTQALTEGQIGRNERHDQGQEQGRNEHLNLHCVSLCRRTERK